ncbi:cupin domain-containing protein [Azospirillum endophyticum]
MAKQATHYIWSDLPSEHLRGSITRRFVTSETVMVGEVKFRKGDTVPRHSHPNEQFTHVISGALKFAFGDEGEQEIVVGAGEIVVIPSGLPHSVEALEDTLEYDIFNPPRQDWIDPSSGFLRG